MITLSRYPFFGDFEKLFGGGQDHWSTAKQIALQMAAGEEETQC